MAPNVIKEIAQIPLPPTTTAQEDLVLESYRKVTLIWEVTQASIAIAVVLTTMVGGIYSMMARTEFPLIIGVAFGAVIGYYFAKPGNGNGNGKK